MMGKYCVGYKVAGRYYAYVEAESVEEARKKAEEMFYDADFGQLEGIGEDCGTEQVNVTNEEGDVVWGK